MIAPLAKFLDWSAIQVLTRREPPADGQNSRLEEALRFLNGPDFIPAESRPAQIEFYPGQSRLHFRFPTPRPSDFEENNFAYGRLYRCAERWQERPVIVLLHGSNDFISYRFRYPLIARHYNQAGFNVATLAAPYHFQRRPRQLRTLSRPDYLRLAKTHAQAVAEIRALTGWLLGQGCPAVALCGSSYGARLAGLTVSRDARLAAVVLNKPAVGANPAFAKRLFKRRLRESWLKQSAALEALNLTPFNLTLARPAIPKENILLIEAIHDLYVPKEAIEDFWQAWGQPEIWRLPHGHLSTNLKPGLTCRILHWLAPRLEAGRKTTH